MFETVAMFIRIVVRAWAGMVLLGIAHHEISTDIPAWSFVVCFAIHCYAAAAWDLWRKPQPQAKS